MMLGSSQRKAPVGVKGAIVRGILRLVRTALALAVLIGLVCAADYALHILRPENTRHARFGEECRAIHADLAKVDGRAPAAHCIRVHFGTPRRPVGAEGQRDFGFGGEFDDALHLGFADVSLPLLASEEKDGQSGVRKRGDVVLKPDGSPDSKDDTTKYASITTIDEHGEEEFVTSLNDALDESDTNALLVFVHGYNQSFDTAVLRAAQIAVDLTFDKDDPANVGKDKPNFGEPSYAFGRPVLFSWPNGAFLCAYCSDQEKAALSAPYLARFLTLMMERADADEINLVVHSMGNRVLVRAIEDIAREHVRLKWIKKFRIVNAAADVARDEYSAAMARAEAARGDDGDDARFTPDVTIYASQNDLALATSWLVNGFKTRLGQIVPTQDPYVHGNGRAVTIDTAVVSSDLFGHGYYSANGNVIADMSCFFADRPIGTERALAPASDGRSHYRFVASTKNALAVCAPGVAPLLLADPDGYFAAIGFSYDEFGKRRLRSIEPLKDCWDGSAVPQSDECPPAVIEEAPAPSARITEAVIYFPFGESFLDETAAAFVEEAARRHALTPYARVIIVGHTDEAEAAELGTLGAQRLSERRAAAVKEKLIAAGVPIDRIETSGRAAIDPAVPTARGVREPANRRVTITILG